ncbi:Ninja-family protein [Trichinella spiralis]|uniref:Ninja-family protein n=1 Tax=Trichinella spiralis TaxID=6334 RepID=A0ABR3KVN1_TRISP
MDDKKKKEIIQISRLKLKKLKMESCLTERDETNLSPDRLTASDRHLLATNELSNSVHSDYYSSITVI